MSENCPLCNSSSTLRLETISGAELNALYERYAGIRNALKAEQLAYMQCQNCKLRFCHPIEPGNEELYEQLQVFDWYYMDDKAEFQIARPYLPTSGSILEVGSGRAAFASLVGAERYTGLEFNDKAIEKARSAGVTLVKESVESHALQHFQQYDAVVSFQVLEHVSSPSQFIKGCVDCLKPGGVLILAVPSRDGFAGESINNFLDLPPHHVSHWSEFSMRKIAEIYGLQVVSISHEPVAGYHDHWARKVKTEFAIRRVLGIGFRLVDLRYFSRIISKLADIIARIHKFSLAGVNGHTIIACYRKM